MKTLYLNLLLIMSSLGVLAQTNLELKLLHGKVKVLREKVYDEKWDTYNRDSIVSRELITHELLFFNQAGYLTREVWYNDQTVSWQRDIKRDKKNRIVKETIVDYDDENGDILMTSITEYNYVTKKEKYDMTCLVDGEKIMRDGEEDITQDVMVSSVRTPPLIRIKVLNKENLKAEGYEKSMIDDNGNWLYAARHSDYWKYHSRNGISPPPPPPSEIETYRVLRRGIIYYE